MGAVTASVALLLTAVMPVGMAQAAALPAASGLADVAYAGSLLEVNERVVGPAFTRTTGFRYQGRGAGSLGLAKDILAGEIHPGVFMSVGAAPIQELEPRLTDWYVQFLASPLVVAYNPHTKYAAQLQAIAAGKAPLKTLFTLMAQSGFRLGRTNPNTDPQGQAFVEMVELAQRQLGLPASNVGAVLRGLTNSPEVFAETALDAQLQSGQLDAASAFLSQAIQLHLPYISLPAAMNFGDPALAAVYAKATLKLSSGAVVHGVPLVVDATVLAGGGQPAEAFLAFLLSAQGRAIYRRAGYTLLAPTFTVG